MRFVKRLHQNAHVTKAIHVMLERKTGPQAVGLRVPSRGKNKENSLPWCCLQSSFLFSVQCDPSIHASTRPLFPGFWLTREATEWRDTDEEWLRVGERRWAGQSFTVPCLRQTVQTLLCSSSSGLPALYSEYGSAPGEAVDAFMCVCVCARVWSKRGQAVINSGLAMTCVTVNSRFSLHSLYTVNITRILSFGGWSRTWASTPSIPHRKKKKKTLLNFLSFSSRLTLRQCGVSFPQSLLFLCICW